MSDEKRFLSFLVLSLAIMTSYIMIHAWLFPPPVKPKPGEALPKASRDKDPQRETADAARRPPEATSPSPSDTIGPQAPAEDLAQSTSAWTPPQQDTLVALGSLSADSPYRFLAIFDSRGATIRSIELTERTSVGGLRYRELDDDSGYLANMALTISADGQACQVNVVGDGTPAALAQPVGHQQGAGLLVGDQIRAVDGKSLKQLADELSRARRSPASAKEAWESYLRKTRPGDEITLRVRRGGQADVQFKATLTRRPLEVIGPERTDGVVHPQSLLLSLGTWQEDTWNEISPKMRLANWETKVVSSGREPAVEFRFRLDQAALHDVGLAGPIEVVKRFRLTPTPSNQIKNYDYKSYHLSFEIEIHNLSGEPQSVAYRLDGPTGLPSEGWWYQSKVTPGWSGAGARDVVWASEGRRGQLVWGCPTILKNALKGEPCNFFEASDKRANRTLRNVGGDTQYFATVLLPAEGEDPDRYAYVRGEARPVLHVTKEDRKQAQKTNTSFHLVSESHEIGPTAAWSHHFTMFAGPKRPGLLVQYDLSELTYYGWFGFVSIPLVGLLHLFEMLPVVNYGVAIILLTVLVRGAMVPISRKAVKNAQMMQFLQPEMKKIAEKYKNDMEKRGRAQQELFRKYNYNPFGGCLLMFLQLPVFLGLYRGLSVDIALRDQPLIPGFSWCSNLAGPDQLLYWRDILPIGFLTNETGFFGPYLNILPIITVVLFLVQQKMFTPPPTDEQQAMTHRMMMFMTVFLGFMFFKVPSGLCIYFITSSLWSVAERQLLPKPKLPDHLAPPEQEAAAPTKPLTKPGPNGSARVQKAKKKKKKRSKGRR